MTELRKMQNVVVLEGFAIVCGFILGSRSFSSGAQSVGLDQPLAHSARLPQAPERHCVIFV